MTNGTHISKIQLRAQILEIILKFKNENAITDKAVEEAIDELSKIEDKNFVISLLIKEISGTVTIWDNILCIILSQIADSTTLYNQIFETLKEPKVPDRKKFLLINFLREQGQNIDYANVAGYIKDPDSVIVSETQKFLLDTKLSPEAQIDFFDFYFTVGDTDKKALLDSIIDDYNADELANILSLFLYFYADAPIYDEIIETLAQSKSYYALDALNWFIENTSVETNKRLAKRAINNLKIAGLREIPSKKDIFKDLLKNSKPMGFYYSLLDGNSNISCVFARQKANGGVQTFFTVFNLLSGPVACFGFDEVDKEDFEIILGRFFKKTVMVKPDESEGKLLFDYLSNVNNGKNLPYEFVAWRQLTYDIEPCGKDIFMHVIKNLSKTQVNAQVVHAILNSNIFSNWYYTGKNLVEFKKIIEKVETNEITSIIQIELLLHNCANFLIHASEFKAAFDKKLMLQAFLLYESGTVSTANCLYGICFDNDIQELFLYEMLKRSLYEYFISIKMPLISSANSIFIKKNKQNLDFANEMIKIIEERWT